MTIAGLSRSVRLFGTDAPIAEVQHLRAGELGVEFTQGNLRAIRFKGHEILRAIAYVVRDRDWGTFDPVISGVIVDAQDEHFEVQYTAQCEGLNYTATIQGNADGSLKFSVTATPNGDFETNRCGFCVLHPIVGVAGKPVTVEHCDGSVEDAVFPGLIDPWQPFKSIRSLTHDAAEGIEATCRLTGDEFEMEDQRNWSDASYKTYVRPLALPWPYLMPAGITSTQTVELDLKISPAAAAKTTSGQNAVRIRVSDRSTGRKVAETGLLIMPEELQDTLTHCSALKDIGPSFLLCHVDPTLGHGEDELVGFAKLQNETNCSIILEYIAVADGDLHDEFQELASNIQRSKLRLDGMVVCPSVDRQSTPPGSAWPECPPLSDIYKSAREHFPNLAIGGGMVSYFTELNRKQPPVGMLDFVTHGTNPIVHAADDASVMQTLEALPFIFRSARQIIGENQIYRLGPSFIPMRQNPYGSRVFDNDSNERKTMAQMDPRQRGLFAASFIAGYAARVAGHDIASFVPASLFGPAGLLPSSQLYPQSYFDKGGGSHPALHIVKWLCGLAGQPVINSCSHDEAKILSLTSRDNAGLVSILVSNITADSFTVIFDLGLPKGTPTIVMIDEDSFPLHSHETVVELPANNQPFEIRLKAYAVAFLRYKV